MSIETTLLQLQFSYNVIKANVGGMTHEESLRQPTPAGNCANWVLGHLVATRCGFLEALGSEAVWGKADCAHYDRHGPPITPANAKPLNEIWEAFDATQERLRSAVSALTPEMLSKKSPIPTKDSTVGSMLAVLGFHDAYHAGQTGILRRIMGKPPADL